MDDEKLLADIETYGWHVILIPEDEEGPGYGFTVGLFHSYRHPEIVLFGLCVELTHQILNVIGEDVARGITFKSGQESMDVLEGLPCVFHPVDQQWYGPFLGTLQGYYQGDDFPVLQCFWPDRERRYPWDQQFFELWADKQPWLISDDLRERLASTRSASG